MSSHPSGVRFSPFSGNIPICNNNISGNNIITKNMQPQPQQMGNKKHITNRHQFTTSNNLSGSETDLSTSTENLSIEQRYVLRHTPRVEPQGQENLQDTSININENQGRFVGDQRFSSGASTDSTRCASSNRSASEARNSIFPQQTNGNNSLKEMNSNRSSMDVSTCSYNTLIIHNDESMYSMASREFPSPPPVIKKERPRSYGEQGMQEITEIPDDYLNQSHVLKHLAKEIKIPIKGRSSNARDSGVSENTDSKENQKFDWIIEDNDLHNKSKSKSQPDLTKLNNTETETLESLSKENAALKQQLLMCCMKVAKTQKLEDEVTNIYRVYEELVQSCDRREKLERVARMRLQENLQKVQALNRALKDQVDIFQTQLLAPSEHQILIAHLFTQNKELCAAKERQDIELAAQQATLQEQRTHIGILDTALNNAQRNIRRLEDELRKKQMYIERLTQMCGVNQSKQNERKLRLDFETELSKDCNRSGSSTNSDSKWQLQEKNNQVLSLEGEQRHLEEQAVRQNTSKLSLENTSQETDRMIAEVKHDKLRYLEEVHSAQRKVNDLQSHLKILENKLAEKDALIRALQSQKICGSSFDSYNLSTETFALNALRYNSPSSFHASNTSFNTTANTSLMDPTYPINSSNYNPVVTISSALSGNSCGQSTTTYNPSIINLQSISIPGNYSPNNSNYSASFDPNSNYIPQSSPTFNTTYDNQYDEHMKKQIDEQISKFETLQRGLCCFPSLSNKKPNQPLLSDEVSVLSTNNSDAFLQKLVHLDQREREQQEHDAHVSKNKTEEIVLLEKQGRCSQKIRNNASGNLAQVTQSVGQNMTDISNIGNSPSQGLNHLTLPPRKERGNSLPPSALPRPPRGLKPPRKIEYDRLSDTEIKKRSYTPPKLSPQRAYEIKTSSLKRDIPSRDYSPVNNYNQSTSGEKSNIRFKRNDYGTMNNTDTNKLGFKNASNFCKPDYNSTKKYQRLEENTKIIKITDSNTLKKSLLPSTRKINMLTTNNSNISKCTRDSFNSNGSNTSNQSGINCRTSPVHLKSDSNSSHLIRLQHSQIKSSLPIPNTSASLPPKPVDNKSTKRSNNSRNGENRYRIQF